CSASFAHLPHQLDLLGGSPFSACGVPLKVWKVSPCVVSAILIGASSPTLAGGVTEGVASIAIGPLAVWFGRET
ncbi:hypothetical protein, partial [Mesorhizobium sp. M1C.F.Ca.ET.204.01.1.1]|uniref:hypothetical protein n=1 Tax=Mesorhizobium sp. M1C.F.Ca.ET.204.01.1.1 TaxID=2563929 RepID=UPI001AEE152F